MTLQLQLQGQITAFTAAPIWRAMSDALERHPQEPVVIDASRLERVDGVGLALLFDLKSRSRIPGADVEIRALAPELVALLDRYRPEDFAVARGEPSRVGIVEAIGRACALQLDYLGTLCEFVIGCLRAAGQTRSNRVAKWTDVLDIATRVGASAVPIILLVGLLMGVIIGFELGLLARQFGATIFVVNGIGISVLRELGALMTAIIVAGRTGAAFAAQLGAQKVNEEVDALSTFGIDPIEFLVLPRLLATTLMLPLLTVLADVAGIFGGALVMTTFDVSFLQFYSHLLTAVTAADFLLGLTKAAFFGLTIAAVGCHRGLATGAGAIAVGQSATDAVVTSIVLIVVIDGIFAVFTN